MEAKKSEARIQSDCYLWFNNSFPSLRGLLYHVPNGELRDPITANKLKSMGVVSGIPDIVFHHRSKTYFFEFKKPGEDLSDNQKKIHAQLDLHRFIVFVVDNQAEFEKLILAIINDTDEKNTFGMKKEDYFYRHNIFQYLYNMDFDTVINLDNLAKPETRKKFMYYVTEFIVEGFDREDGFELLYTDDYTGIYKQK